MNLSNSSNFFENTLRLGKKFLFMRELYILQTTVFETTRSVTNSRYATVKVYGKFERQTYFDRFKFFGMMCDSRLLTFSLAIFDKKIKAIGKDCVN